MKKIHKTNLLSKIISFMLAFVMMGCMLVPVGYADSHDEYVTDDEEEIVIVPFELPLLPGDLTPEEAKDNEETDEFKTNFGIYLVQCDEIDIPNPDSNGIDIFVASH